MRGDKDKTPDTHSLPSFSYSVLPENATSTLSSTMSYEESPATGQPVPPTNQNQTNRVPLAVGLTLGLLALIVLVLGSVCYLRRRKRRTLIDVDGQYVSPYNIPQMRQPVQQSSLPQDRKRPPQPVGPSSAELSSSGSTLGPPPSYQTPTYDWRVGTVQ